MTLEAIIRAIDRLRAGRHQVRFQVHEICPEPSERLSVILRLNQLVGQQVLGLRGYTTYTAGVCFRRKLEL